MQHDTAFANVLAMPLPGERRDAIKKALLDPVNWGRTNSWLADVFQVSPSTITKYRDELIPTFLLPSNPWRLSEEHRRELCIQTMLGYRQLKSGQWCIANHRWTGWHVEDAPLLWRASEETEESAGNVYIIAEEGIEDPNEIEAVKIGCTRGPVEVRLRDLQTGNPRRLSELRRIPCCSEEQMRFVEKNLHRLFEPYKIPNGGDEWFHAPPILEDIKQQIPKSWTPDCYQQWSREIVRILYDRIWEMIKVRAITFWQIAQQKFQESPDAEFNVSIHREILNHYFDSLTDEILDVPSFTLSDYLAARNFLDLGLKAYLSDMEQ